MVCFCLWGEVGGGSSSVATPSAPGHMEEGWSLLLLFRSLSPYKLCSSSFNPVTATANMAASFS